MRKGFTLVELLVVITIIAILMTIGIVSFSAASIRARDSKRKGDLSQTQAALELYRSSAGNGTYPVAASFAAMTGILQAAQYLSAPLPVDPKTPTYTYVYTRTSATSHCICAQLESGGTTGNSSNTACNGVAGTYWCMTNP